MVNFPGRNDRRRRVLKEEVLSATGSRAALRSENDSDTAGQASRYSDAASVENHPQVTDFVPRRYSTIALLVFCGVIASALTAAIHYFALPFAESRGMASAAAFDLGASGNLANWLSAIVLFLSAGFCVLTYSIRRHRIDDIRGRYRIWLAAALACTVLSANSVVGLHQVVSDLLGGIANWTALRQGAIWWLALAGMPLAWVFGRVLVDTRECRMAALLFVGALVCYAVGAARFFGFGPAVDARIEPVLIAEPLLLGHWLVFAAVVANARFVVLDAQGLVSLRRRAQPKKTTRAPAARQASRSSSHSTSTAASTSPTISIARQISQAPKRPADSSQWVDGSRPERNQYDEDSDDDSSDGDRKLNKADRKRMRKLKAQNRAA